jgi:hypothetical protein
MYKKKNNYARQGLQCHLEKATGINITDKDNFKKSTQAFKAMAKELKSGVSRDRTLSTNRR